MADGTGRWVAKHRSLPDSIEFKSHTHTANQPRISQPCIHARWHHSLQYLNSLNGTMAWSAVHGGLLELGIPSRATDVQVKLGRFHLIVQAKCA